MEISVNGRPSRKKTLSQKRKVEMNPIQSDIQNAAA